MGIAFFTCLITAALGGSVFAAAGKGPAAAVLGVQKAIDAKDMPLLERHLDLDGVVAKAVTVAVADASVREAAAQYPAAALVFTVGGEGASDALRNMLAGEVMAYVRHGVTSGAFAGAPKQGTSPYRGILGSVFRGGTKDTVLLTAPTVTRNTGEEALVTATATYGGKGEAYPLTLRVRKEGDVWRIAEIVNMPDLVRRRLGRKR